MSPITIVEDEGTIDRQALDKLAAARIWLTKERPLLGVLARPLRPEISRALTSPLAILPDDRLLVQPELALRTPFPQLCARVAHVTLHAALGGFARRGQRRLDHAAVVARGGRLSKLVARPSSR